MNEHPGLLSSIPMRTRGSDTTDTIRRAVLGGVLPRGSRLKDVELAKSLGVSRATVREAVRPLVQQGILVYEPFKGLRVAEISDQALRDLAEVRVALESLAALRVAAGLTPATAERLRDMVRKMHAAEVAAIPEEAHRYHFAFHRLLIELAGMPVLNSIWTLIEGQTQLAFLVDLGTLADLPHMAKDHERLVQTLVEGKPGDISRQIDTHIVPRVSALITARTSSARPLKARPGEQDRVASRAVPTTPSKRRR